MTELKFYVALDTLEATLEMFLLVTLLVRQKLKLMLQKQPFIKKNTQILKYKQKY